MAVELPATIHCKPAHDKEGLAPPTSPLVDDIIQRWRDGDDPSTEAALALHPALGDSPDAMLRLIYEEVCLRREQGELVDHRQVIERYPRWRAQLDVLLRCHSLLNPLVTPPNWPKVGDSVGEYELIAELGRGGHGRVFLANQPGLGDRPVVVKLTPRDEQEHLTLARLQHTHIVPLYAACDDPVRRIRALCMPYYGGAPLHELIPALYQLPATERSGQQLLSAIDRLQFVGAVPPPSRSPSRLILERCNYVEAVCWIGACVAEALEYAHERGLLHLDLKPSNVLLATDGQPMLLDFHLARAPLVPGAAPPQWFGGTPGYMSPEQEQALNEASRKQALTRAVDERSDVYGLGLLLYEALGGTIPRPPGADIAALRKLNPDLSTGLIDIVRKCLAEDPADRYQHAKTVAADLRRHLSHLPLKGVPNRSLTERWWKWRRRQPSGLIVAMLGATALAALVGWGLFGVHQVESRQREAEQRLAEGLDHYEKRAYGRALDALSRSQAAAARLPGAAELRARIEANLQLARRAQSAEQLHELADRVRFAYEPAARNEAIASMRSSWPAVWERRRLLLDARGAELEAGMDERLRRDLLDLCFIWADLSARQPDQAAQLQALQALAEAESLFGPSHALYRQRQLLAEALGRAELVAASGQAAAALPPRTAWEHYALGRSLLHAGDLEGANAALQQAVDLQPHDFWPNFYHGMCAQRRGRYADAVTAFSVCIALAPDSPKCHYNRALALAARGNSTRALRGYDRALALDPHMAAAALNRGLLQLQLDDHAAAERDLRGALALGANAATVHYNLARIELARGNRLEAFASARRALAADPTHTGARQLRQQLSEELKR